MNPSKAMLTLCQRFLDQHKGEERSELLNQIIYDIKSRTEIGTPCPATANMLSRRICTLLTSAGKLDTVKEWYQEATQADLSKETLEEMASCCSSIYMSNKLTN
jgi:hypothetical protein